MSELKLSINNCFAAKRWVEPDVWASIVANDLRLANVQFSFDLLDPAMPEPARSELCGSIRRACVERRVSLDSTFTGVGAYVRNMLADPNPALRNYALSWYEYAVHVSSLLGARATGGFFGSLSMTDLRDPDRKRFLRGIMVENVRRIAAVACENAQDKLLWELMPHPREIPHDPEEAVELLTEANERSPIPIGLCFDMGHCCAPDLAPTQVDPCGWLERLLPWTHMVHLQQTDGKGDRHWPFTREYNAKGCVDPKRVVEIVRSGPVPEVEMVLEICHGWEIGEDEIIRDLKESVEVFAQWL